MRMNGGRDEFLFFGELGEKRVCFYLFLRDDGLVGLVIANKLESRWILR